MAKRVYRVNDKPVVAYGDTVHDVLEAAGKSNAPSVNTPEGVVKRDDFRKRLAPPEGMSTNSSDVDAGESYTQRLLEQDIRLIVDRFLAQFPDGPERYVTQDEYSIKITNFPLPDGYYPDHINLLIVTVGYPNIPPAGIHAPKDSPLLDRIALMLGGHVIKDIPSSYKTRVEELENEGWRWICYHYHDWQWNYNPRDILEGDCLYKYVERVFSALGGNI